jgi:hypothetical protein
MEEMVTEWWPQNKYRRNTHICEDTIKMNSIDRVGRYVLDITMSHRLELKARNLWTRCATTSYFNTTPHGV